MTIRFSFGSGAIVVAGMAVAAICLSGTARAITDTTFKYSSPVTGYVTIDAGAVNPAQPLPAASYSYAAIGGLVNSGTGAVECFVAGVNFPDQASISSMSVWYSSSASGAPSFSLGRRKLSTGSTNSVAAINPVDTSGNYKAAAASATPTVAKVNNLAYSYDFLVCLPQNDRFYGARIKYTYTTAGD